MASVTYNGPKSKADPTNRLRVPRDRGKDFVIRRGQTVDDVPSDVVKVLKSDEISADHDLDFASKPAGSDS